MFRCDVMDTVLVNNHMNPIRRPTHGYMKFCTKELNNHVSKYEELVHKTMQKMLHILVSRHYRQFASCDKIRSL